MAESRSAAVVLDECFLEVRAKLLEVAASLDRIERAERTGEPLPAEASAKHEKLMRAVQMLQSAGGDRAARVQRLFSREYDPSWREQMELV